MSTSKPLPHTLSAWLKELDGVRLPVSNDEHRRVLHTLRDNKSSLGEIAESLQASPTLGSVVASDAFFPFADGLIAAAEAGATAIIQPGGSLRDDEVIAAADAAGLAMVFTNQRHFRH